MSSARRFSNISNAATTLPERSSKRLCQENNQSGGLVDSFGDDFMRGLERPQKFICIEKYS